MKYSDNSLVFLKVKTEPKDTKITIGIDQRGKMNYIQRINHWKAKFADLTGKELKISAALRAGSPDEIIDWIKRQIKLAEMDIELDA